MSPFIDAGTREKISFVKGEAALADLRKVIPPEVGTMNFLISSNCRLKRSRCRSDRSRCRALELDATSDVAQ